MTEFRYFADPHRFADYESEPRRCDVCRAERPGYEGPFRGADEEDEDFEEPLDAGLTYEDGFGGNGDDAEEDTEDEDEDDDEGGAESGRITFVCEECLADGALADLDVTLNAGDMEALREQLAARHPETNARRVAEMVEERFAELAERTPRPRESEGLLWPAHCGDFCRHDGEDAEGMPQFRCLACGELVR